MAETPPSQGGPTYYMTQTPEGADVLHCLYCEEAGSEHHATDPQLFAQHMAQRHDGRLAPGTAPEGEPEARVMGAPDHPHGGPPGHEPDFVPPGHGGTPPGQEAPPEEPTGEPQPEHPIVTPEPPPEEGA